MQYYTFELDDYSKNLCTIATPFGLYKYNRLPMGISQSPDIAQEVMERVLRDIEDIEVYIEDIAIFTDSFESQIEVLDKVLNRLNEKHFIINPRKCEFCIKETDFLGHWLTPEGIRPYPKKIKAILAMQPPRNLKQLRAFLGLVTYYRDMWPRRSHILAPLTDLLKHPRTFLWDPKVHGKAFNQMKAIIQRDTMLMYPDHNKPFHIETDASDFQLGAVIKQDNRPVAFYTRKLNSAQRNYTTIEKELLSVVETLKEFRSMLLGAELHVYTDHKNLTHHLSSFTTQRVLRWKLLLEEYSPTFHYIQGPKNIVADSLSRTPTTATFLAHCDLYVDDLSYYDNFDNDCFLLSELADGLLALPARETQTDSLTVEDSNLYQTTRESREREALDADAFLLNKFDDQNRPPYQFKTIHHYQQLDEHFQSLADQHPNLYFLNDLGGYMILCRRDDPTDENSTWKIMIPTNMLTRLVKWYHKEVLYSCGMDRLEQLIGRHFYHPHLRKTVRSVISACKIAPIYRSGGRPSGELSARNVPLLPWHEVHLDCIGSWPFKYGKKKSETINFRALTCVDPVTNFVEIIRIPYKISKEGEKGIHITRAFHDNWLARYTKPAKILTDNGTEFTNHEFQLFLDQENIKWTKISPNTPTGNSIAEATHKIIGQVMRTLYNIKKPTTEQEADRLVDEAIGTAIRVMRSTPVTTLGNYTPGALVFNRDMFLNLPVIADLITLTENRQALVDKRLLRANRGRASHDYKIRQKIYYKNFSADNKMDPKRQGPFEIVQVHCNGTITIAWPKPTGIQLHRISIRHVIPYKPQ